MTIFDDWKESINDYDFVSHDKNSHDEHCATISNEDLTAAAKTYWKREYGVNSESPLNDICDITQCLPQDILHILVEGVCEVAIRAYLRHFIVKRELFDCDDLNDRIKNFNFNCFSDNKPAPINEDHIQRQNSLKQTASQIFAIFYTLPFLLLQLIEEEIDREQFLCYTLLLQITSMCFAYEITDSSLIILQRMIEFFCLRFKDLYPDAMVPCTRFVAKHSYFRS